MEKGKTQFHIKKGCDGMTRVSQRRRGRMAVLKNDGYPEQKVSFSAAAKRSGGNGTFATGPWMPINLCTPLTHADRAVE